MFLFPLLLIATAVALAAADAPVVLFVLVMTFVVLGYLALETLASMKGWGRASRPEEKLFGLPLHDPLRGLPWSTRRAVTRAVRKGAAVSDPRDAATAVALAQHVQKTAGLGDSRRFKWAERAGLLVLLLPAVLAVSRSESVPWWTLVGALPLALLVLVGARFKKRAVARAAVAEDANRRLADLAA